MFMTAAETETVVKAVADKIASRIKELDLDVIKAASLLHPGTLRDKKAEAKSPTPRTQSERRIGKP